MTFAFEIAFWFPSEEQLTLPVQVPPANSLLRKPGLSHTPADLHEGKCSWFATVNTPRATCSRSTGQVRDNLKRLQGGSCRPLANSNPYDITVPDSWSSSLGAALRGVPTVPLSSDEEPHAELTGHHDGAYFCQSDKFALNGPNRLQGGSCRPLAEQLTAMRPAALRSTVEDAGQCPSNSRLVESCRSRQPAAAPEISDLPNLHTGVILEDAVTPSSSQPHADRMPDSGDNNLSRHAMQDITNVHRAQEHCFSHSKSSQRLDAHCGPTECQLLDIPLDTFNSGKAGPPSHAYKGGSCRTLAHLQCGSGYGSGCEQSSVSCPAEAPFKPISCAVSGSALALSAVLPVRPLFAVHDSSNVLHDVPGTLSAVRKKPQSKQHAFRIGATPYAAPKAHHPGLQRPLYLTGHFRVEQPLVDTEEGRTPSPFTSFDAVNGPMTLAGEAEWQSDAYIAHALEVANLPGSPLARFLRHEIIDHPSPQVVLTQDHGPTRMRAVVCDFRPLKGKLEVIDANLAASVLDLIQASRSIPDAYRALDTVTGISCTTLVNRLITPPDRILPPDVDLVLFQLWADGAPTGSWRPFVLGDARPPVPPIPGNANTPPLPEQRADASRTGATGSQSAFFARDVSAHVEAPEERYTYLDTLEGVQNRPKPPAGNDNACLQDALASVPRRGTPLSARLIIRPLTGLYLPQILLSRVSHRQGWHTIAVDLRAINLGIKVIDVVLGTSIRQLMSIHSPFYVELAHLGRGDVHFSYLVNLQPCVEDVAFHMHTDTLTLVPLEIPAAASASSAGPPASARWARRLGAPPRQTVELEHNEPTLYTVYDVVHHHRTFRRDPAEPIELLIARAISVTPEIADAEGHVLLHGIAEMPFPQIVLVARHRPCCVVPLLYKRRASAFETAFCASQACRALPGAQQQIARRTAAITGHHGSSDPFKPGCVREHETLVLRGFVFGVPRPRVRASHAHDRVEARQPDLHEDPDATDLHMIRVIVTRGQPGCSHLEPVFTLPQIHDYIISRHSAGDSDRLRWPAFIPALPGATPMALLVTQEAEEAPRWSIVDIRRVGHPPLLPLQTVPLPPVVEVSSVLGMIRHELPSLRPIAAVYLDDHALSDSPVVTANAMTLTLMRSMSEAHATAEPPVPGLDMNVDLMERRVALYARFNSYPPSTWPET